MATITLDYDSNGDIELILQQQDDEFPDEAVSNPGAQLIPPDPKFHVISLGLKVKQIHLRVSSKKLISSSVYFKAMLEGPRFREGSDLQQYGFVKIDLSVTSDDPEMMALLLAILYKDNIKIPVGLSFEDLKNVAILVDKYQWHALVAPHAARWYELLRTKVNLDYTDSTSLDYLWMAWVFGLKDHFNFLSYQLVYNMEDWIDPEDYGIRLPSRILGAINERRKSIFHTVEKVIEKLQTSLLDLDHQKKFPENASMIGRYLVFGYGTFCSQQLRIGQFSGSYASNSVRQLGSDISKLTPLYPLRVTYEFRMRSVPIDDLWDLKSILRKTMTDLEKDGWGLSYDDFKSRFEVSEPKLD